MARAAGFHRPPTGRGGLRRLQERVHDTYRIETKPREPIVCPGCGAALRHGRWRWEAPQGGARRSLCPACRRIRDGCPAGTLTLGGAFVTTHEEEILAAIRGVEAREKAEHPLHRIMRIGTAGDDLTVTTTDMHLARGIGEALHRAYRGTLDFEYVEGSSALRVRWRR